MSFSSLSFPPLSPLPLFPLPPLLLFSFPPLLFPPLSPVSPPPISFPLPFVLLFLFFLSFPPLQKIAIRTAVVISIIIPIAIRIPIQHLFLLRLGIKFSSSIVSFSLLSVYIILYLMTLFFNIYFLVQK